MAACYKSRLTLSKRVESNKRKVRQVRRNQEAKSLPPLYVLLLRYVITLQFKPCPLEDRKYQNISENDLGMPKI